MSVAVALRPTKPVSANANLNPQWKCFQCSNKRSATWLLTTLSGDCISCIATCEAVQERAAIYEFDALFSRDESGRMAIEELTFTEVKK